jgi:hypothetical protein
MKSYLRGVNDVRQAEMHTGEPLLPESSPFKVEIATEKLQRYVSPGIDQIPIEMIQAGGNTLRSETHKMTNSIWKREKLSKKWKESIIVPIYGKRDKTD